MKKIIALLLSIICLFSCMTMPASADFFQDVIDNVTVNLGMEPDEPIIYGITYASDSLLTGVTVMYMPSPTFSFTRPGTYVVTDNVPLSVDYEFVCWVDADTGENYYAGDTIYIDGQKTLNAKWVPKTDGKSRVIRVIVTALETFRSTLRAFFGFYAVEFEEDPTASIKEKDLFSLENLLSYRYYYGLDKRYFQIAIEPIADGVVYEPFTATKKIYFGGESDINEYFDDEGKKYYREELVGATMYSAEYKMTHDIHTNLKNGVKYQLIEVNLTNGVPDPETGHLITFTIPRGLIRYKDSEGKYQTNKEYSFSIDSTPTISPIEENHFPLDNITKYEYDYSADKRTFKIYVEPVSDGIVYDEVQYEEYPISVGDVPYTGQYNMTTELVEDEKGIKYQVIEITFKSTVDESVPAEGEEIVITIPQDMLSFKHTDGKVKSNKAYKIKIDTTAM